MTSKTAKLNKPKKMTIDELAIIVSNGFESMRVEFKEDLKGDITGLRTEMNFRFDQVDQRFDVVDRRLTRIETDLSEVKESVATHERRINRLEDKVFVEAV